MTKTINADSIEFFNQTKSFIANQDFENANLFIDKAIASDRMNKELYIYKCIVLANLGQIDEAIEAANNALKVDSGYGEAYFHIGNLLILKGDRAKGIVEYNKAIANGFDESQVYYNLGLTYEENGNIELAIRNYSKAILKDELRSDARVRKINLFIQVGKTNEALEDVDQLILTDPDLFDGYHLKFVLLSKLGKHSEALDILDEGISLFPQDPSFLIDKVSALSAMNNLNEAKRLADDIKKGFELGPVQKRALELELGKICAIEQDMTGLISHMNNAKEITMSANENDCDPEATFFLANCYVSSKDFDNAILMCNELLESDDLTYKIPAYYILPFAMAESGEVDKAKEQYVESISKLRSITLENPQKIDGYIYRALCLKDIGEYDKALELCDYMIRLDNSQPSVHELAAQIYTSKGDTEKAEAEERLAKSLNADL